MLDKSAAIAFVNALLEVALKKGNFEQIEKELDLVSDVITRHDNLKKILFHPSIPRSEKKDLIKNVFGGSVSDLMKNFLYLLVDRRKIGLLEFIPEVYKTVASEKKGIVKARVQTVIPLAGERLDNFKKQLSKLTGKTVEVEVVHNPDILGGVIIQIGNKMIDGSVVSKLKNLKTRLLSLRTA
ncbi:MAG: ATP synthase F1 subunit delta [Candidatus Jettenia sp. CY-1]|nr:ATP synthase F1 subunit delta [Candidatus Jettenia sp.]WKZ18521.1 MAG: ATP synthase F1 subunit delta [Candidatus Jettenia sp. CY-1]